MKITVLVFRKAGVPHEGLRVAEKDEWTMILKKNKTLRREDRRFFVEDRICDGDEMDCMDIYAKAKYNRPEELSAIVNAAFNQNVALAN